MIDPSQYQPPSDPNAYAVPQAPGAQQQMPGGIDPATMQAILQMNTMKAARDKAGTQMRMADQMRADAKGQLEGSTVGRMYRAPGVGNLLANVAGNAAGAYMQGGAQGDLDKI